MQIDIYLAFTSCQGNCIFCEKGQNIVQFPRPTYMHDYQQYEYYEFHTEKECVDWFSNARLNNVENLNISGNEPTRWTSLSYYIESIKKNYSDIYITLRISNTILIQKDILNYIDSIELSLYGSNKESHNYIMRCSDGWDIFHQNLNLFLKTRYLSIQLQTICIKSNLNDMNKIVQYLTLLSPNHPIKIIYPCFMPRQNLVELLSKKQIIKTLIAGVPKSILERCILQNFPSMPILDKIFYDVRL